MNAWKWVPNALTLGNLLGGVVVCWAAASGSFLGEALVADWTDQMVFWMQEPWPTGAESRGLQMVAVVWSLAMLCDVLDGWAARKLGVAGPMGVQLDSLADVVTGGVAPAMVAMRLFQDDGGVGMTWEMLACLGVAAAAAYRLARFNVATDSGEGGTDFEGLPAPAAGVFWMGVMLAWGELQGGFEVLLAVGLAWIGLVVVPLAMVSRRKMWGLKGLGKDAHRDKWRGVFVAVIPGIQVSTWWVYESVFLAVPLCLLLYLGLAMATTPQSPSN